MHCAEGYRLGLHRHPDLSFIAISYLDREPSRILPMTRRLPEDIYLETCVEMLQNLCALVRTGTIYSLCSFSAIRTRTKFKHNSAHPLMRITSQMTTFASFTRALLPRRSDSYLAASDGYAKTSSSCVMDVRVSTHNSPFKSRLTFLSCRMRLLDVDGFTTGNSDPSCDEVKFACAKVEEEVGRSQ